MAPLFIIGAVALLGQTSGEPRSAPAEPPHRVQPEPDTAPPSAWDFEQRRRQQSGEEQEPEERSFISQMVQTLFALVVVVALIYLVGKFGLSRLSGLRLPGRTGDTVKVIERLQLDARHSLFLVKVRQGPTLLLGSGDRGVHLISELDIDISFEDGPRSVSFKSLMQKVATPRDQSEGERHD